MSSRHETLGTLGLGALLAVLGLAVGPFPAGAQEAEADARWLPWAGCWESVAASEEEPMRCVRPTAEGAELLSVAGDEVIEARPLRADGSERPAEEQGCTGVERGEFSGDVGRVYWTSELECRGGTRRESSRMWDVVGPAGWIEVRSVWVHGGEMASVDRYRPAPTDRVEAAGLSEIGEGLETAIESARLAASARLAIDHVVEAQEAVGAEVVEAWIAERDEPIEELDADALVRLADAGVPADVIDVAVAVSYPDKFRVEREPRGLEGERAAYGPGYAIGSATPWGWYDPWSWRYSPYGYSYGRRFLSPYGGYPGGFYGGPTTIIVRPVGSSDDAGGRVFRDRGYRQRRPSDQASSGRPASGTRSVTPSRRPSSSGSSTGRKAKPRSEDPPDA